MSDTLELILKELQSRIGHLVSQYETQVAILKVQAKEALEAKDLEIEKLQSKNEKSK
jgi:hypothetical protein